MAQSTISIVNGSFEESNFVGKIGKPKKKTQNGFLIWLLGKPKMDKKEEFAWIKGWERCGNRNAYKSQIYNPSFNQEAKFGTDGENFLLININNKREFTSISQQLDVSLNPGNTYEVKMDVSRLALPKTKKANDKNIELEILIWAGSDVCESKELLAILNDLNHCEWQEYTVRFSPSRKWKNISIQGHYSSIKIETSEFNEFVCIDNISDIYQVSSEKLKRFQLQINDKDIAFKKMKVLDFLEENEHDFTLISPISSSVIILKTFYYQYKSYGLYRTIVGMPKATLERLKMEVLNFENGKNWISRFDEILLLGESIKTEGLTARNKELIIENSDSFSLEGFNEQKIESYIDENIEELYDEVNSTIFECK